MSRHRRPDQEDGDVLAVEVPDSHEPERPQVVIPRQRPASEPVATPRDGNDEVAEDDATSPDRPVRLAVVTARRPMIAPAAPSSRLSGSDGAPGAITSSPQPPADPVTPASGFAGPAPAVPEWSALDRSARVRREWADAPGSFVRMGVEGPRTLPSAALPALPPRSVPPEVWGPWPPEPSMGPPPARRGPGGVVIGAIAVLLVLLVGLGVGLVRPELFGLSGSSPFAAGEPAPGTGGTSTQVAPAADAGTSAPVDPTTELQRLARSDAAELGTVENAWVPQLSSKRPGTVSAGRTYDAAAILAEHEELRARHPQARLLWSGDWPVFDSGDYWVTVLATPSSSAGGANSWCDDQGFGADECFAKWLSRSGGSAGSAVHR